MTPSIKGFEVDSVKEAKEIIKKFTGYSSEIVCEVFEGKKRLYKSKKKPPK